MNLRVNLFLPGEQRSATPLNPRTVLRVFAVAVPGAFLLLIVATVSDLVSLRSELNQVEARWRQIEPKKKQAEQEQADILANKDIAMEIEGWSSARFDWGSTLAALCADVPTNIQFIAFQVSQDMPLIDKKVPARVCRLQLAGRASGRSVEVEIEHLRDRATKLPIVASARITQYGADTAPNANEFDRVFGIECVFKPQAFK